MSPRERRILVRAMARQQRRQAAVDWFWLWCRKHWNGQPHAGGRIRISNGNHVPALHRSPHRHTYIFYEDCVHLAEEAYMLVQRLMTRRSKRS